MIQLPNDGQDRYWVQAEWTEKPIPEKEIFATLVTVDEDDELSIPGNAFVIRDNGDSAICLGAAHSFEKVKRIQRARSASGHFNMPIDFRPRGPEYLSPDHTNRH